MNPVNLYISTCRYVIESNPQDPDTWAELYRYIPFLRQALSCCVCTKVFHCPMGPEFSKCYHHVCKECLGGKMRLKPSCSWCNNFDDFIEKPQLKIIVRCFKKLCEYIASSAIALNLTTTSNGGTSGDNQLLSVIQEGISIQDDLTAASNPEKSTLNILPPVLQKVENESCNVVSKVNHETEVKLSKTLARRVNRNKKHKGRVKNTEVNKTNDKNISQTVSGSLSHEQNSSSKGIESVIRNTKSDEKSTKSVILNEKPLNDDKEIKSKISETVKAEHDYIKEFPEQQQQSHKTTKLKSRRASSHSANVDGESSCKKTKTMEQTKHASGTGEDSKNNNNSSNEQPDKVKQSTKSNSKTRSYGCRCGLAAPKPGNLTCCGQRCPCYSAFKGCEECKCRGCRNPRGDPAKNPLAALRLQRQLQQNVHIIQPSQVSSHGGVENMEISETVLPVHSTCVGEEELNIVDIDI